MKKMQIKTSSDDARDGVIVIGTEVFQVNSFQLIGDTASNLNGLVGLIGQLPKGAPVPEGWRVVYETEPTAKANVVGWIGYRYDIEVVD